MSKQDQVERIPRRGFIRGTLAGVMAGIGLGPSITATQAALPARKTDVVGDTIRLIGHTKQVPGEPNLNQDVFVESSQLMLNYVSFHYGVALDGLVKLVAEGELLPAATGVTLAYTARKAEKRDGLNGPQMTEAGDLYVDCLRIAPAQWQRLMQHTLTRHLAKDYYRMSEVTSEVTLYPYFQEDSRGLATPRFQLTDLWLHQWGTELPSEREMDSDGNLLIRDVWFKFKDEPYISRSSRSCQLDLGVLNMIKQQRRTTHSDERCPSVTRLRRLEYAVDVVPINPDSALGMFCPDYKRRLHAVIYNVLACREGLGWHTAIEGTILLRALSAMT